MHRYHQNGSQFNKGSIYPIQNRNLSLIKPWKHRGNNFKHKRHHYRYSYDPRFYYYGNKYQKPNETIEINIVFDENENVPSKELPTKKKKTYPPPHIFNLNDYDLEQTNKHFKSAKTPNGIILIQGTRVSEVKPAAD